VISLRSVVAPEPGYSDGARSSLKLPLLLQKLTLWRASLQPVLCAAPKGSSPDSWSVSRLLLELFSCVDVFEESHSNRGFASYWSSLGGAAYLCDYSVTFPAS